MYCWDCTKSLSHSARSLTWSQSSHSSAQTPVANRASTKGNTRGRFICTSPQYISREPTSAQDAPLSHAKLRFDVLGKVNRLHGASAKTRKRMCLRKISRTLADVHHLDEHARPFNPRSNDLDDERRSSRLMR